MHKHILHTYIRSAAITLTHKAAHHWVSGRWLPWQHIPSHVAAWSEVWCCWTSLLSLLYIASFMLLYRNTTWHRPDPDVHILPPNLLLPYREQGNRTVQSNRNKRAILFRASLCLLPQYVIYMHQLWWNHALFCVICEAMNSMWCRHEM